MALADADVGRTAEGEVSVLQPFPIDDRIAGVSDPVQLRLDERPLRREKRRDGQGLALPQRPLLPGRERPVEAQQVTRLFQRARGVAEVVQLRREEPAIDKGTK